MNDELKKNFNDTLEQRYKEIGKPATYHEAITKPLFHHEDSGTKLLDDLEKMPDEAEKNFNNVATAYGDNKEYGEFMKGASADFRKDIEKAHAGLLKKMEEAIKFLPK